VFLPVLEFPELYRRNLNRLLGTGRYVPGKAMWDSSQRIDGFVKTVLQNLDRESDAGCQEDSDLDRKPPIHSKFEFDKVLTRMANFELRANRTVGYMPPEASRGGFTKKRGRNV